MKTKHNYDCLGLVLDQTIFSMCSQTHGHSVHVFKSEESHLAIDRCHSKVLPEQVGYHDVRL